MCLDGLRPEGPRLIHFVRKFARGLDEIRVKTKEDVCADEFVSHRFEQALKLSAGRGRELPRCILTMLHLDFYCCVSELLRRREHRQK